MSVVDFPCRARDKAVEISVRSYNRRQEADRQGQREHDREGRVKRGQALGVVLEQEELRESEYGVFGTYWFDPREVA